MHSNGAQWRSIAVTILALNRNCRLSRCMEMPGLSACSASCTSTVSVCRRPTRRLSIFIARLPFEEIRSPRRCWDSCTTRAMAYIRILSRLTNGSILRRLMHEGESEIHMRGFATQSRQRCRVTRSSLGNRIRRRRRLNRGARRPASASILDAHSIEMKAGGKLLEERIDRLSIVVSHSRTVLVELLARGDLIYVQYLFLCH